MRRMLAGFTVAAACFARPAAVVQLERPPGSSPGAPKWSSRLESRVFGQAMWGAGCSPSGAPLSSTRPLRKRITFWASRSASPAQAEAALADVAASEPFHGGSVK